MGRNTLKLELGGFEKLLSQLDELGGNLKEVVTDALEQSAETIEWDTLDALDSANMPAGGKYSKGDTERSVVRDSRVRWEGTTAVIGVGFDYSKDGAGGYLITGTPRMKPNYALEKIYAQKKYMNQIKKDMNEIVKDAIDEKMGG